jgi:hypothetical protein
MGLQKMGDGPSTLLSVSIHLVGLRGDFLVRLSVSSALTGTLKQGPAPGALRRKSTITGMRVGRAQGEAPRGPILFPSR